MEIIPIFATRNRYDMELLKQQVEALIFCSEQSIGLDEISAALKLSFDWEISDAEIKDVISETQLKYQADEYSFELVEISEGFQFLTKKSYFPVISSLIQNKAKKKLSIAQMETLSIIAYRQPISKAEVEHIRGVSCDYAIQKLLEKELIEISGKSDGPGRPILYSTSGSFMDYFGIKSVKDLPQLKDIHIDQNEIGMANDMMDGDDNSTPTNEGEIGFPVMDVVVTETNELGQAEAESGEEAEVNSESMTETINELQPEDFNMPDRKTIFMANDAKQEQEIDSEESKEAEDN